MNFQKFCAAVFVFAMTIAVGSASAAVCSNASLNGVVGYITAGVLTGVGTSAASMGQVTYDGKGSFTATGTNSVDGAIAPVSFSGTYSIESNCTGSVTITSPNHATYNIVLDDMRKGYQLIETDGVYIASGFGIPQGTATCNFSGKKLTFAASLAGSAVGLGPVVSVSQVMLNGKGGLSGSATFDLAGTLESGDISGSYTANSDCTGTAQITLSGFTINFNLVAVNSGKELLAIETDNDTVVVGTFQE